MTDDKTRAIVLTTTPINDRMQFVHFYTERLGRVTCRVPVVQRGRRVGQLRTMMTPMTVLDVVLGGRPTDDIRTIAEAEVITSPYMLTVSHPEKSVQCLFMAELIAHTVREQEANPRLWQYFSTSLEILEHCEEGWANFHLIFTSGLTNYLGFGVDTSDYQAGCCFDMREGTFLPTPPAHPYYFNHLSTEWFCRVLETPYSEMHGLLLNRQQRAALTDMLLAYIGQQIPEMGQLRSVDVLRTLFE